MIFNPIKITDWRTFRRRIEYELSSRGWQPALWLETSPTDPGRAMTQQALAEDVDLVLGVGGDGGACEPEGQQSRDDGWETCGGHGGTSREVVCPPRRHCTRP